MPAEAVIKKLKEKLILTALESPEFKDLLKETLSTIKEYSEIAENEASIESVFEKELYGLLRNINFRFLPTKEFPVETRRHIGRGRIDSKIDAVIIEYKHYSKLTTKGDISKAIDQLETYIRGLSSKNPLYYYGFLTDGIKCLEIIFENNEKKSQSGLVKITEQETFRLIKNIVLLERTALTSKNLIKDFCYPKDDNLVYKMTRELFSLLKKNMTNKTRMLKLEWEQLFRLGHDDKSQQRMIQEREKVLKDIIGSKFNVNDQYTALFALQTTYAIIIKLIAYRTLSEIRFKKPLKNYREWLNADGRELRILCEGIENGDVFHSLGISNLLEGDFFSWYSDYTQWNSSIACHIRIILEILARYENTNGIFKGETTIDLFKDLYQSIVPQVVRSSLGEFYTPYWLAEHLFKSVKPKKYWRGLDPCAGSGTFVLVMVKNILSEISLKPKEQQLKEILDRVQAIDINPLAVLTSRINYFICISHLIPERPVHLQIPVYLGDACYVPENINIENIACLKYIIKTVEKPIEIIMPKSLTADIQKFSKMMNDYETGIKEQNYEKSLNLLINNLKNNERSPAIIQQLINLTNQLISLERKNWNGIWARIIGNFLITANLKRFDIIIGNPPWIDWKNLPSNYRKRIKSLCIDRKLFSGDGRTGGINLNVCALIASVSIDNWLEKDGKLAFLMPKVIAFQQSYDGFRKFRYHKEKKDFIAFYDWSKAGHPFYPIKERFMTYVIGPKKERDDLIPVKHYIKKREAKIAEEPHISLREAMKRLIEKSAFADQVMPHNTAFTITESAQDLKLFKKISGKSDYIGREGIEFYPQELLLFHVDNAPPIKPRKGYVYVKNAQFTKSKYKIPRNIMEIEAEYLFPLVKGPEIEKFKHNYSGLVVPFPYKDKSHKRALSQKELSGTRLLSYYLKYKEIFQEQNKYSDKIIGPGHSEFYSLARVGPYSFAEHYVAYRDNSKWGAVVISPKSTKYGGVKRFLFQNHAVAICEDKDNNFISKKEAHYICAILNAPIVENYILNSSDSRSFKIRVPLKIPKYNQNDKIHARLAQLSIKAHKIQKQKTKKEIDCILEEIDILYIKLLS